MRRTPLLFTLALLGCASTGASPDPDVRPDRVVAVSDNQTLHLTDSGPDRVEIAATADKIWDVLLQLYPKIGIPLTTIDKPNWRVGNAQFTKMRTLANERMSNLLNCGQNMTGSKADNDRITMSVHTTIRPNPSGSGSLLITAIAAEAVPVDGTSTERSPCGTSGALERIIARSVSATLGLPSK